MTPRLPADGRPRTSDRGAPGGAAAHVLPPPALTGVHALLDPRRLHVLTDGRDVPDGSSLKFVEELEALLKELQVGAVACWE